MAPHQFTNPSPYRRIGRGNCGSVWTDGSKPLTALKREDAAPTRFLWKDYFYQTRALEAMNRLALSAPDIQIPFCRWYINDADSSWWEEHLAGFPKGTLPCNTMCSDLIPPVPQQLQTHIIDTYCPAQLRDDVKQRHTSQDCIARLYMGRRRTGRLSQFFSLHNYPLWLNQMEDMKLPIYDHAKIMGETLAMIHWEAELDANDVEFVLGATPSPRRHANILSSSHIAASPYNTNTRQTSIQTYTQGPSASRFQAFKVTTKSSAKNDEASGDMEQDAAHSTTQHTSPVKISDLKCGTSVWLLDFDCCGRMSMDAAGIEAAVWAFYRNDPYYPRPGDEEGQVGVQLWEVFKSHYLALGEEIVRRKGMAQDLPARFIDRLVELSKIPRAQRCKEPLPKHDGPWHFFLE